MGVKIDEPGSVPVALLNPRSNLITIIEAGARLYHRPQGRPGEVHRASLLIASGASHMKVAHQMGHSKVETTKNIYGHLFAQDWASILEAMNEVVSRLHAYESPEAAEEDQAA